MANIKFVLFLFIIVFLIMARQGLVRIRYQQTLAQNFAARATVNDQPPGGAINFTDCSKAVGWAYDPNTPDSSIEIVFYADGPVGRGTLCVRCPGHTIHFLSTISRLRACGVKTEIVFTVDNIDRRRV